MKIKVGTVFLLLAIICCSNAFLLRKRGKAHKGENWYSLKGDELVDSSVISKAAIINTNGIVLGASKDYSLSPSDAATVPELFEEMNQKYPPTSFKFEGEDYEITSYIDSKLILNDNNTSLSIFFWKERDIIVIAHFDKYHRSTIEAFIRDLVIEQLDHAGRR